MKNIVLLAGNKLKKIARVSRKKYLRFLGRSSLSQIKNRKLEKELQGLSSQSATIYREQVGSDINSSQPQGKKKKLTRKPKWSLEDFQVTPVKGKSRFHDYPIPLKVMRGIADLKFQYCTSIQEKTLTSVLNGHDLVGKANTGTGKTAVFLITILSRLIKVQKKKGKVYALVLAPTRELVVQIAKDGGMLGHYSGVVVRPVFGGTGYQKQIDFLFGGRCDVVIATPGRLLDLLRKNIVDLSQCSILVLDEADRMLDMGFIPDVRRIVERLPSKENRQTLLFSATVSQDVQHLASKWCRKPKFIEAEKEQVSVEAIEQIVYLTTVTEKYIILYNLIQNSGLKRILVFVNMKRDANKLEAKLLADGVSCVLLSGDVVQKKRISRLEDFRSGNVKVLVATDVAGRGIHIENIDLVVNYTLPFEPEDYVHRIGRTGRAGTHGKAVSFACEEGAFYLPHVEDFIGTTLECVVPEDKLLTQLPQKRKKQPGKGKYSSSRNHNKKKKNRKRQSGSGKNQE